MTIHFQRRLRATADKAAQSGLDAVVVTPGSHLKYLVGYDAVPLERLTALVIPASGDTFMVVPGLERLAALASPAGSLGIPILTWEEAEDPYRLIAERLAHPSAIGLADDMTAAKVLRLREAMPQTEQRLANVVLDSLRQFKDLEEIAALREAAAAIDAVHALVPDLLRPGRTEAEVAGDIDRLIRQMGHDTVDFVIVASGPNGASPHHAVSDRVINPGEPIVVDIGGTMPSGYCSDSTRTYCIGEPPAEYAHAYERLRQAQELAVKAVAPGTSAGQIDSVARSHLGDLAPFFIHRTGHGIGLDTHEEPYIMAGSDVELQAGMVFSVEPGFYIEGRWGARIEDIVVCTDNGVEALNKRPHELLIVPIEARHG